MTEVDVRVATPDDMRFVCASWFESYWKNYARDAGVEYSRYRPGQDGLIKDILKTATVNVVYYTPVPDEILGYCVVEGDCLHYVYVKSVYRRQGIAKGLLAGRVARYSHKTRGVRWVAASLGLVFDPYTLTRR